MSFELIAERETVAGLPHSCIWCNERILIREKYVRVISKYCGDFQNHAWHPECKKAADEYFAEHGESEFEPHVCKRGTICPT